MEIISTQAITLQSTLYKDKHAILKLFTEKEGVISVMLYGLSPKKPILFSLASPITRSQVTYKRTSKDICQLIDAQVTVSNLPFRKDLSTLRSASLMIKALLLSQLPHKKAKKLFSLCVSYLDKMPTVDHAPNLAASFLLKLLLHEGLLKISPTCNHCENPSVTIESGESLCHRHMTSSKNLFSSEELSQLFTLAYSRQYDDLFKKKLNAEMLDRVKKIFHEHYS